MIKPELQRIKYADRTSLNVFDFHLSEIPHKYHLHPEVELTWVFDAHGSRYVGNHIGEFGSSDLVLLGASLPHTWFGNSLSEEGLVSATILQFLPEVLPNEDVTPEMHDLSELLSRASRGLSFGEETQKKVGPLRKQLLSSEGLSRMVAVLEIFQVLARAEDVETLATQDFQSSRSDRVDERLERTMNFLGQNFSEPISLDLVAHEVGMSRSAFCRFFTRATGCGLIEYLTDLRLSHACIQLRDSDLLVVDIAYDSGFSNLSNFNRQFKRLRGMTPLAYRQKWRSSL